MRFLSVIALSISLLLPTFAQAQNNVVVELFTSQGCSSCPPADQLVLDLAHKDPGIIVLGWHVDYWDYLGWKDEYSSPMFTARQAGYREHWHLRSLYTPQIVVHGRAEMVGSNARKVYEAIAEVRSNMQMLQINLSGAGNLMNVSIAPAESNLPASEVLLISVIPSVTTDILRGENAGRSIEYVNVVTGVQRLAEWDSRTPIDVNGIDLSHGPYVLLIQARDFGPILGARLIR